GDALGAPALDPIACWRVERAGETVFVRTKLPEPAPPPRSTDKRPPASVLVLGGGGARLAASQMLRRQGYEGPITILRAADPPPCDRPNLSKDFLAGTAPEDWMPLRGPEFYTDQKIDLVLQARAASIDVKQRTVQLDNGKAHHFDALLIATGA